ncbi:hypothetical protein NQZ68_018363 [Dissostichus eleginoides]|nr:hypothetical protein NQZ68_018363 [Dissostichus eleginoides]
MISLSTPKAQTHPSHPPVTPSCYLPPSSSNVALFSIDEIDLEEIPCSSYVETVSLVCIAKEHPTAEIFVWPWPGLPGRLSHKLSPSCPPIHLHILTSQQPYTHGGPGGFLQAMQGGHHSHQDLWYLGPGSHPRNPPETEAFHFQQR